MSVIDVDALVNDWLISKWLEESQGYHGRGFVAYDAAVHGPASGLRVRMADADWECGCWSEYTRDDTFVMKAVIETAAGVVDFEYGVWFDIPSFIEELDAYRESRCRYNEDEEDEA
ncbi:hypothetical protein [Streptomyces sennicomposti]